MAKKKKKEKNYQSAGVGQEWFDKEYTAREVYGRLWGFARRSKRLIFLGAFLGMLTGGLWAPLFTVIQPMMQEMQGAAFSTPEAIEEVEPLKEDLHSLDVKDGTSVADTNVVAEVNPSQDVKAEAEESTTKDSKLEGVRNALRHVGVESEATVLSVLAIVMVLAVVVKMTTQYFNHYYLTKAGMLVVMDVRNAMFEHLQAQSLSFHGRSDVGKLMSRATGDPETIRTLISQTMSDICRAPFEILVAIAFVCYHAIINDMVSLLLIALLGYPACMLPVVWIGKKIRK
ncbi:MAG: ABC transporter transmembrane domain-containing protein, partial [bacterium]|nr:ABC transporter transmembrane domain-containing protein [bacterium]